MVETPGPRGSAEPADLIALSANEGAALARLPAASLLEGAAAYAALSPVRHLVMPSAAAPRRRWMAFADRTGAALAGIDVTWVAPEPAKPRAIGLGRHEAVHNVTPLAYVVAIAAVLATAPVLILLRFLLGDQGSGLLLVFPVLGIAARFGLRPALVAIVSSTLLYDLLVLRAGTRNTTTLARIAASATARRH